VSNVTGKNKIPLVLLTYRPFNFKVRDVIWKNFHILKNDPETSSIFSNNHLDSFRKAKNIRETLAHNSPSQDSSSQNGTFSCRVAKCKICDFINSATTISAPKSQYHVKTAASHEVDVACFMLEKLEVLSGQGLMSIGAQSLATMLTSCCQTF
jgi:hypothetical protein